mmetsp:Transcript_343/g.824  ORF Transcript_343/g.824 Transcript_343/m.824 type:complete len:222 (-) Transcript_343:91-756(-)
MSTLTSPSRHPSLASGWLTPTQRRANWSSVRGLASTGRQCSATKSTSSMPSGGMRAGQFISAVSRNMPPRSLALFQLPGCSFHSSASSSATAYCAGRARSSRYRPLGSCLSKRVLAALLSMMPPKLHRCRLSRRSCPFLAASMSLIAPPVPRALSARCRTWRVLLVARHLASIMQLLSRIWLPLRSTSTSLLFFVSASARWLPPTSPSPFQLTSTRTSAML